MYRNKKQKQTFILQLFPGIVEATQRNSKKKSLSLFKPVESSLAALFILKH